MPNALPEPHSSGPLACLDAPAAILWEEVRLASQRSTRTRRALPARGGTLTAGGDRGVDGGRFAPEPGLGRVTGGAQGRPTRGAGDQPSGGGPAAGLSRPGRAWVRPYGAAVPAAARHDPAGRMNPDSIDRVLRKHAAAIGLGRGYSVHSMRATFITTALRNGAALEDVQMSAGPATHPPPSSMTAKATTPRKLPASSLLTNQNILLEYLSSCYGRTYYNKEIKMFKVGPQQIDPHQSVPGPGPVPSAFHRSSSKRNASHAPQKKKILRV